MPRFEQYWLPRFRNYPFYFVTFLSQSEFDKLAPLHVTPAPDTVIRVFMDYKGLNAPIEVHELELPRMQRKGFTVVEWGGAARR